MKQSRLRTEVDPIDVASVSRLEELAAEKLSGTWFFRGTLDDWDLETSLERSARDWGMQVGDLRKAECLVLREFKRAFPPDVRIERPEPDDTIGWLALMQHFGAPTRLLDWTYSLFVAAYFALEKLLDSRRPDASAVIWAVSAQPLKPKRIQNLLPNGLKMAHEEYLLRRSGAHFEQVFINARPAVRFVAPVNPWKLNPRLVVQQGVFLCPGAVSDSFETNLKAVPGAVDSANLMRLRLSRDMLEDGMLSLHRMNINRATLFPGLDGFAQRHRYRFKAIAETDVYRVCQD